MFGYGKKNQAKKLVSTSNHKTGLLYYKVGKDGAVTNFQAWLRGCKEHKITEYDLFYQEGLTEYKREPYDMAAALQNLEYQSRLTIWKDIWREE
jgi:predicted nucleic acid-binding protein